MGNRTVEKTKERLLKAAEKADPGNEGISLYALLKEAGFKRAAASIAGLVHPTIPDMTPKLKSLPYGLPQNVQNAIYELVEKDYRFFHYGWWLFTRR